MKGVPLVAVSAVWYSLSPHLFWKSRKKVVSHERDRTFGTMASDNNPDRKIQKLLLPNYVSC